jgi:hypothetical protein
MRRRRIELLKFKACANVLHIHGDALFASLHERLSRAVDLVQGQVVLAGVERSLDEIEFAFIAFPRCRSA